MTQTHRSATPWQRTVTTRMDGLTGWESARMSRTEYLDMRAASERLWDAMRKRPDAGVAVWLDVALNGWGNPDVCPKCGEDHAYCDPTDQCKEGTT